MLSQSTTIYCQDTQEDFGRINPEFGVEEEYNTAENYQPDDVIITEKEDKKVESKGKKITAKVKKDQSDSTKTSSGAATGYSDSNSQTESVLSFNFLYYIIQKFKFAEVVDQ